MLTLSRTSCRMNLFLASIVNVLSPTNSRAPDSASSGNEEMKETKQSTFIKTEHLSAIVH